MAGIDEMIEAFRAAMQEPPSIVERLRQGLQDPYERAVGIAEEYKAAVRVRRPKGQRPDGSPVSTAEKKAILAESEQLTRELERQLGAQRVPLSASAAEPPIPPGHASPYGW